MKKLKFYIITIQIISIIIILILTSFLFLSKVILKNRLEEYKNSRDTIHNFVQGFDTLSYLEEKEIDKLIKENNIKLHNISLLKEKIQKFEMFYNIILTTTIYINICLSTILLLLPKKNL